MQAELRQMLRIGAKKPGKTEEGSEQGFTGACRAQTKIKEIGAAEWIRTTTVLLPPAPQAGASASSATTAQRESIVTASWQGRKLDGSPRKNRRARGKPRPYKLQKALAGSRRYKERRTIAFSAGLVLVALPPGWCLMPAGWFAEPTFVALASALPELTWLVSSPAASSSGRTWRFPEELIRQIPLLCLYAGPVRRRRS